MGEQAGARDLQVLLAGFGPGPGAHRGLVAADDPGEDDQRPDRRVRCGHRAGGAVQQRVHPPVAGPDPGHRREDVRAPLDRDVVHHHQEHAPGLEVQPVGHRARRARLRRGVCDVDPAARALHLVPGVLDGQSPRLGQVGDLVRVPHPQVAGIGQVSAAAATALREVRDDVVRDLLPGQERARRAGLLARLAAAAPALPALRRLPPRQVISARRHRRVPAVAGDQPLQPRDPVLQLRDLGVLVLQQHPQPLVRLPQPAGSGPDKQAGVMIDDDDQVLVALAVGDLVDPDPPQPGQPVGAGGSLGGDPGDDVPDGPPPGAHQLADGGLGGRARQPGDGVLERAGMPGAVPRPRHGCDRHAVPGAGHPRRGAFQLGPDRAQVQGPPPAPLALVIARAAAPADPAPPGPAPVRPDPGDYRDLRLAVRPGIFLPADPLDHGAAFDSQHPRP